MCHFGTSRGKCIREWETGLAGVDCGFIHQKDGNIVAYWIDAPTLAAFQSLAIVLEHQRFLAYGADEDVEQIFGKHDVIILACFSVHAEIPAQISDLRSILQSSAVLVLLLILMPLQA